MFDNLRMRIRKFAQRQHARPKPRHTAGPRVFECNATRVWASSIHYANTCWIRARHCPTWVNSRLTQLYHVCYTQSIPIPTILITGIISSIPYTSLISIRPHFIPLISHFFSKVKPEQYFLSLFFSINTTLITFVIIITISYFQIKKRNGIIVE